MMTLQVIGSLILILGGLLLVLHLLKKYVPSMAVARDLAVTEQLHLGDRCRVDGEGSRRRAAHRCDS